MYHTPVLLKQSINGLNIKPDGIYVDLTFGGGGHSKEILKRLTSGRLIAFDYDKDAEANVFNDVRFMFVRNNFKYLKNFLRYYKIKSVDGIIADLGVSSHHFDTAERGFSFRFDGKLDMRMNKSSKLTASTLLNTYTGKQLYNVFTRYGEIKNAHTLTELIMNYRSENEISTTRQLKEIIAPILINLPVYRNNKFLAKVFQALRIEVNKEIDVLKDMLLQTIDVIKKQGRLVVISYHSLEDRIVKNFITKGKFEGDAEKDFYGNLIVPYEPVNRKIIIPDADEIKLNSRAKSAKLRIAKRI